MQCIMPKLVNITFEYHKPLFRQGVCWLVDIRHSENWKVLIAPDLLLNNANRQKFVSRFKEMKPIGLNSKIPKKRAAVFVPLCVVKNEVSFLYTLRASNLKSHRREVSFPGGVQDDADNTLEQTAIRETCEELGINKENIEIWGQGAFVGTRYQDMAVMPFVGFLGDLRVQDLHFNPEEVESVFIVPLRMLCDPRNCKSTQYRNGYVLPVFIGNQHRIWGMTAIITCCVLNALLPSKLYVPRLRYIKNVCSTEGKSSSRER